MYTYFENAALWRGIFFMESRYQHEILTFLSLCGVNARKMHLLLSRLLSKIYYLENNILFSYIGVELRKFKKKNIWLKMLIISVLSANFENFLIF